jgi:hypothetical protein
MTDKTRQDSGSTHIIRYALELGLLWIDGDGRDKVREALDALNTLEAQLEAIGAGGVSGPLIGRASLSANAGEPVAWLESEPSTKDWPVRDLFFGFTRFAYSSRLHMGEKPKGADQSQNRFTPLYAAPPTAQAEGWRLVPVEPTKAMLLAGSEDLLLGGCIGTITRAAECYRAMISAAPTSAEGVEHG